MTAYARANVKLEDDRTHDGKLRADIRPRLKRGAFQAARSRLGWLPVHLGLITLCISALQQRWLPWPAAPFFSLVIGLSFAGLTFLGHETLHGAIVRGPRLRY